MDAKRVVLSNSVVFENVLRLLEQGMQVEVLISGNSMNPALYHLRDEVRLTGLDGVRLKPRDVVLYRRDDGAYVLHRLCKVNKGGLYMAGDAETELEGPLYERHLLAAAVGFRRKGRYFPVTARIWRVYSFIWVTLRPFRKPLLRLNAMIGRRRSLKK